MKEILFKKYVVIPIKMSNNKMSTMFTTISEIEFCIFSFKFKDGYIIFIKKLIIIAFKTTNISIINI